MDIFFLKYFWIAFILTTVINAVMLKSRSREHIEEKPELEDGYNMAAICYATLGNIPWVIMGYGILAGYTNTIFDYFRPRDLNPVVLVFYVSIIILVGLMASWVFIGKGVDFFARHPGLISIHSMNIKKDVSDTRGIKAIIALMIVGTFAVLVLMWFMDMPRFNF